MTTGILALIIFLAIIVQIALLLFVGIYRRKQQKTSSSINESIPSPEQSVDVSTHVLEENSNNIEQAWDGFKEFIVERRVIENSEQSICSFYLLPSDKKPLPSFKPGQFLTFKLSIEDPKTHEHRNIVRCYSLSDSPNNDYYRITVKRVLSPIKQPELPSGLASNYLHDHINKGDHFLVKAPSGHFHLMENESLPLVLIGGGIGVTPMLSILNTLIENNSSREIWFFYGVRNSNEQIMKATLQVLDEDIPNLRVHICYSRPLDTDHKGVDYQHEGRVDIPLLRSTLKLQRYQFYVCGPQAMMESIVPGLEDWGVDPGDIFYESFGPATLIRQEQLNPKGIQEDNYRVSFSKSGLQVDWDPNAHSLLEFIEAQGINVDSGCRAGSCGCCQTRIDGQVEYSQQPDADIKPDHCLLCISRPKSNITLPL